MVLVEIMMMMIMVHHSQSSGKGGRRRLPLKELQPVWAFLQSAWLSFRHFSTVWAVDRRENFSTSCFEDGNDGHAMTRLWSWWWGCDGGLFDDGDDGGGLFWGWVVIHGETEKITFSRNRPKKRENSFIGLTPLIMKTGVSNIVSVKCRSNDMMGNLYQQYCFVTTRPLWWWWWRQGGCNKLVRRWCAL